MASNNRKMLFPNQPGQSYTFTFYIPFAQMYPPPPPPPPPQRDLSVLFSTSICMIGSFLLFLFLTVFLYLYITKSRRTSPAAVAPVSTNRREEYNEEAGERDFSGYHHFWRTTTTAGLQRSMIDSITVVGFKKGEGIIDGTDCSVCLSEFEDDEAVRLLPKCSHAFHINCIDTWLLSHKNCPLCRAPVFSTELGNKKTETNHHHQTESGTSNGEEEESLGSRNVNVLPRSHSDLVSRCGGLGRLETVRRSFSIGGSSSVKSGDSDDVVAGRSGRHFYSSFSANFFSSSRRSRNQDSVLPNRLPSMSG